MLRWDGLSWTGISAMSPPFNRVRMKNTRNLLGCFDILRAQSENSESLDIKASDFFFRFMTRC